MATPKTYARNVSLPALPVQFHTIVFHYKPHTDELYALILLRLFGEAFLPGISTAKIEFTRTGKTITGRTWQEDWAAGIIYIGCVGGPFDEHAKDGNARKSESSAALVAKALEIENDSPYLRVLSFINEADSTLKPEPRHVAQELKTAYLCGHDVKAMIKLVGTFIEKEVLKGTEYPLDKRRKATDMLTDDRLATFWSNAKTLPTYDKMLKVIEEADKNNRHPLEIGPILRLYYTCDFDNIETIKWALAVVQLFLDNEIRSQEEFVVAKQIVQDIRENHPEQCRKVHGPQGILNILAVTDDNFRITSGARYKDQKKKIFGFDVTVVRKSNGHTMIMMDQRQKGLMDIYAVAIAIRKAEYLAGGGDPTKIDTIDFGIDGTFGIWHLQMPGGNLLNGSDTVPDQPPTKLSLQQIFDIVCSHILKK